MRSNLPRLALALGLIALAPVCAAKSYVVLLKNPLGIDNHIQITNSKGTFGTNSPGFGTEVNKFIQTVHRYEPNQIKTDFSDALESLGAILADGLPPLPHSYTVLLEAPQGPLGSIAFRSESGFVVLNKPGQAVLIDGYSDDPFQVDKATVGQDFGPALVTLDEIVQAGLRPPTYIVLLEDPDGNVGKVIVNDARGKTVIEKAGEGLDMSAFLSEEQLFKLKDEAIKEDFGNAIESTPVLPVKYVLLFQIGSSKLVAESEPDAQKLLEDVKSRPAPDITIDGHTDTVGRDALNDKLSRQRAEYVAELIKTQGAEPRAMEIEYYGKRKPLVVTPDNTPELRNRRVEVTVR
jgi:outer membrane protein OmpA-like peptidoglycan-associated protein